MMYFLLCNDLFYDDFIDNFVVADGKRLISDPDCTMDYIYHYHWNKQADL
ncbi:hypothetical protein [Terribacillus aidingensis]